jgi:hypothetical protein
MSKIIKNVLNDMPADTSQIKYLYSVTLFKTSGEVTLTESLSIFTNGSEYESGFFGTEFENIIDILKLNTKKPDIDTPKTVACIYKQSKDGSYSELFSSISSDTSKLYWSQGQIIEFAKYLGKFDQNLILDQDRYCLLFVINGVEFVAVIGIGLGMLELWVFHLEDDYILPAENNRYIVAPRQVA